MNNSSINSFWAARILALFILITLIILSTGCSSINNAVMRDMESIQFGVASYYGKKFHGNKTACGETFDMYELTAAHRALPFGTLVKVTNTKNGRAVVVKVNDRGPFSSSRVIDLSYAAAQELGMLRDGVVRVRIDIIDDSLAMDQLDGQEFEACLVLGNSIYKDSKLPSIQFYSPFESPSKSKSSTNNEAFLLRIGDELSNLDEYDIRLSGYLVGN